MLDKQGQLYGKWPLKKKIYPTILLPRRSAGLQRLNLTHHLETMGVAMVVSDPYDLKGHLHLGQPRFAVSPPHHDQCAGTATSQSHLSASGRQAFVIPPGICARVVHERLV